MSCCVVGCTNRYDRNNKVRKFYHIPSTRTPFNANRRRMWLQAINRSDWSEDKIKNAAICSDHFISGEASLDYYSENFVPSIFPDPNQAPPKRRRRKRKHVETVVTNTSISPNDCGVKPAAVLGFPDVTQQNEAEITVEIEVDDEAPEMKYGAVRQVEAVVEAENVMRKAQSEGDTHAEKQETNCRFCKQKKAKIKQLLEENQQLRLELNNGGLSREFLNDTEKVKYYTGLPCLGILLSLLNNVKSFLTAEQNLSHFQMLLLTLMQLRLDLPVQHLCHLFNISQLTLSLTFTHTISVLNARLGPSLPWPERRCLQATMPQEFTETFGNRVAIIVDCLEICTERLPCPSEQPDSQFKGTPSMKYLIGITPQGSISFISKGWGGCTSDKHAIEKSGLLDKLLPGDIVLTDIGDNAGLTCAEVKVTKDPCRLDMKDAKDTQAFTHLRMHVSRVIGSIRRKYKMLQGTIPFRLLLPCQGEEMTLLDKIMNVCCILSNMCPSAVVRLEENETDFFLM